MTRFLAVNSLMYDGVLRLYPPDLRQSFGADMAEAFGEDLRCAWGAQGFRGVLSVWWCTVVEFFCVGVPAHAENRFVMVPLLSCVFSTCMGVLECSLIVLHSLLNGRPLPPEFQNASLAFALTMPGLLSGLTASVVVRCADRANLQSLELCQPAAISGTE